MGEYNESNNNEQKETRSIYNANCSNGYFIWGRGHNKSTFKAC